MKFTASILTHLGFKVGGVHCAPNKTHKIWSLNSQPHNSTCLNTLVVLVAKNIISYKHL